MRVAITGTKSGIGAAVKHMLLHRGDEVFEINRETVDLENCDELEVNLENCDVLINNAGHELGMGKSFEEMTPKDIISQVNVNLLSPMLLTNTFVKSNKSGLVINITSGTVNELKKGVTTYYTVKNGLSKFTDAVAEDLKHSFRFVEVVPRRVATNFFKTSRVEEPNSREYVIAANEVGKVILDVIDNPYLAKVVVKDHRR